MTPSGKRNSSPRGGQSAVSDWTGLIDPGLPSPRGIDGDSSSSRAVNDDSEFLLLAFAEYSRLEMEAWEPEAETAALVFVTLALRTIVCLLFLYGFE
jgi:hypothetical protein